MRSTRRNTLTCLVAVVVSLSGCLPAYADSTVLFEERHGQKFLIENEGALDLSGLAARGSG